MINIQQQGGLINARPRLADSGFGRFFHGSMNRRIWSLLATRIGSRDLGDRARPLFAVGRRAHRAPPAAAGAESHQSETVADDRGNDHSATDTPARAPPKSTVHRFAARGVGSGRRPGQFLEGLGTWTRGRAASARISRATEAQRSTILRLDAEAQERRRRRARAAGFVERMNSTVYGTASSEVGATPSSTTRCPRLVSGCTNWSLGASGGLLMGRPSFDAIVVGSGITGGWDARSCASAAQDARAQRRPAIDRRAITSTRAAWQDEVPRLR